MCWARSPLEVGFIRDRQQPGIEAAKSKGIYKGRPATFDSARIVSLRKKGMGAVEIAKAVGCKRGNVYKGAQGGRAELGWQELPPQARMV